MPAEPSSTPPRQARVRATSSVAAGAPLTREQIENGSYPVAQYRVQSIAVLDGGAGQYDSNTVAVLTGGANEIREVLAVHLDDNGGIAFIDGFTPKLWAQSPKLTITRWDGLGATATFLGY